MEVGSCYTRIWHYSLINCDTGGVASSRCPGEVAMVSLDARSNVHGMWDLPIWCQWKETLFEDPKASAHDVVAELRPNNDAGLINLNQTG